MQKKIRGLNLLLKKRFLQFTPAEIGPNLWSINMTSNMTPNMTINKTLNVTLNLTLNMNLSITANITLNILCI